MSVNTEELKRLAEAANDLDPGEWTAGNNQWVGCVLTKATLLGRDISLCVADCTTLEAAAMQNAAFIAAANPAAILTLIQQRDELLAALEQERKRLDWAMKKQAYYGRSPDRLWVDVGTGNHKWFAVYDDNPRATIDELMVK